MNRSTLHRCIATACVAVALAGCAAPVVKVSSGEVVVKERLAVSVADTWNQFDRGVNVPTWTNDGIFVDALRFYVGVKDGELIAPTPSAPKGARPLVFKAAMPPAAVVDLFQTLWSRDGSTVTVDRVEPQLFLGGSGFRFEYSIIRKADEVRLRGVAWAAVKNGELFVIDYAAPRLAFFARYWPRAEAIATSARLR